ncbi:MAG: hypothetical protein WBW04_19800 [Nitrolancea sp.]
MICSGAFEPDLTKWDAWHPAEVAQRFAGIKAPWYVAAGWSIDLFLGGQRREHEDLEVAVPHNRVGEVVAALIGFELFVPMEGPDGNGLVCPFDADAAYDEELHQTWVREPSTDRWRVDIFRDPSDGDTWICRRDQRIRRPYCDVFECTPDGIPYLCPEIALLFKAKHAHLPKNQSDFAAALPQLNPARRRWLAESLALVHPGHSWIGMLAE